jgi:hypothetical protein
MHKETPAAESSPQLASGPAGGPASTPLIAASSCCVTVGLVSTEFPLLLQPFTASRPSMQAQIPSVRCLRTIILLFAAYSQYP